jgi:hypothetical protein
MPAGSGTLSLLFKIDADDKGAQSQLKALETQLGSTGSAAEGATPSVEKLTEKLFEAGEVGGSTKGAITALTESIGGMAGVITLVGVAALTALAAALAECVNVTIELGHKLHDLSLETGLSVENLQALRVAAISSSSSIEELTQGFVRFERAATDGGPKAQRALEDFGLTAADVARDPTEAFDTFLKKFNEIGPSAQRTADTMALFGRGGARLIPTFIELAGGLEEARKKAEELGIAFSGDLAQSSREVADKFDIFKLQLEAMAVKIGADMLPQLSKFGDVLIGVGKALGAVAEDIGRMADELITLGGILPAVTAAWQLFAIGIAQAEKAIREHDPAKAAEPPKPPNIDPWRVYSGDFGKVVDGLLHMKEPIKSLSDVIDKVPDLKPPAVDEGAFKTSAEKAGKAALDVFHDALEAQRKAQFENEILVGTGLRKIKEDRAAKDKADDPTFAADKQAAKDRLDLAVRTAAEEQQLFKQDLDQKIIDQDRFTAFMIASETQLALARRQSVLDQERIDLLAAKTPDERAAIHKKAANDIANIDSALLIKQRELLAQGVKADQDADEKLIENAIRLDQQERKLIEDRNAFRIKSEIETQKAIADAISPENVKPPFTVDMATGTIADIKSTVDALDPATKAWREATFAIDQYNQAMEQGKIVMSDWPQIVDQIIKGLLDQAAALLIAGQRWDALRVAIKALPLIVLQAFVNEIHKMTDAFIESGHTGPAVLKQLVAGVLRSIGEMASAWAFYFASYGIGMLAIGDYAKAALAFAAAAGLEVVALALGFAASKVAPDKSGATSSAAAAAVAQPPQNTTINIGGTAQLGGTPGDLFGAVIASNNQQTAAITKLHDKLDSMTPGDVVTVAAKTSPNAFATGVTNATKTNASFTRALGLTLQPA